MTQPDWLAQQFEDRRHHLAAVAYRILGSRAEADDALQEAWIRASRAGNSDVSNIGGWLTTIVARVCLDMLRVRKSRREEGLEAQAQPVIARDARLDPEGEAILADSVGLALLVVLDALAPAERVAFVLHDMFDIPFEQIAPVIGRTIVATRQLASRARRRVRGSAPSQERDTSRRREIVRAFLSASREGNFEALLALLDPNVLLRADATAVASGVQAEVRGALDVAKTFSGRARAAQPALVDGEPALVWIAGGTARVVFRFSFDGERIKDIELVANAQDLHDLSIELL